VCEGVVDSDPEAISVYVRANAPNAVRVGLETGPTSTWLWTELKGLGLRVICIDARHAKAVLKMQINKATATTLSGSRASRGRVGSRRCPSRISTATQSGRYWPAGLLVKIERHLENHVRGLLKNLGLVIGRAKLNVFAMRAEERPSFAAKIFRHRVAHLRIRPSSGHLLVDRCIGNITVERFLIPFRLFPSSSGDIPTYFQRK
jgi:transposase